eukprot:TRINITY_DN2015_c0_g1_i5.p1 TRINITY_DN2015_c0_g1~~TRINITY_DN2015_c0_g1_i5.p1  ORF type:complete len:438 (+),score=48.75 TRINITY_DN2015_c0_g1_i5:27-1340(+)
MNESWNAAILRAMSARVVEHPDMPPPPQLDLRCWRGATVALLCGWHARCGSQSAFTRLRVPHDIARAVACAAFDVWDRVLLLCGDNRYGQLAQDPARFQMVASPVLVSVPGSGCVTGVACGHYFTVVVLDRTQVYSCGANANGQLGLGIVDNRSSTRLNQVPTPSPDCRVRSVHCGDEFAVALLDGGGALIWGDNYRGQHGEGNQHDGLHTASARHATWLGKNARIACSGAQATAIRDDGQVWQWGTVNWAICGPTLVELPRKAVQVACGEAHVAVLLENGNVMTWGTNKNGELGVEGDSSDTPVLVGMPSHVTAIACGAHFTAAVADNCRLFTWGENFFGSLGLGLPATCDRFTPCEVRLPACRRITQLACGGSHTIVTVDRSTVFGFGRNCSGELCLGSYSQDGVTAPQRVPSLPSGACVTHVACGSFHSAFIVV